jgi:predicted transcriptional regulator
MKSYEELLKTDTYWLTRLQTLLFNAINDYMKENHLNRKQLAEKLGVSKGYITQIMNGDFDHKLSTFVKLILAVQKVPDFKIVDPNEFLDTQSAMLRSKTDNQKEIKSYLPQVTIMNEAEQKHQKKIK